MKTTRIPYDLTLEVRAVHRAHHRARYLATLGLGCAIALLAFFAGSAIANCPAGQVPVLGFVAVILIWGAWGARLLLTRH